MKSSFPTSLDIIRITEIFSTEISAKDTTVNNVILNRHLNGVIFITPVEDFEEKLFKITPYLDIKGYSIPDVNLINLNNDDAIPELALSVTEAIALPHCLSLEKKDMENFIKLSQIIKIRYAKNWEKILENHPIMVGCFFVASFLMHREEEFWSQKYSYLSKPKSINGLPEVNMFVDAALQRIKFYSSNNPISSIISVPHPSTNANIINLVSGENNLDLFLSYQSDLKILDSAEQFFLASLLNNPKLLVKIRAQLGLYKIKLWRNIKFKFNEKIFVEKIEQFFEETINDEIENEVPCLINEIKSWRKISEALFGKNSTSGILHGGAKPCESNDITNLEIPSVIDQKLIIPVKFVTQPDQIVRVVVASLKGDILSDDFQLSGNPRISGTVEGNIKIHNVEKFLGISGTIEIDNNEIFYSRSVLVSIIVNGKQKISLTVLKSKLKLNPEIKHGETRIECNPQQLPFSMIQGQNTLFIIRPQEEFSKNPDPLNPFPVKNDFLSKTLEVNVSINYKPFNLDKNFPPYQKQASLKYIDSVWKSSIEMPMVGDYWFESQGSLTLNNEHFKIKISSCPNSPGKINVNVVSPPLDTSITLATVSTSSVFSATFPSEVICPVVKILPNSSNEDDFLTIRYYGPSTYNPVTYPSYKEVVVADVKIPKNVVISKITTSLISLGSIGVTLKRIDTYGTTEMGNTFGYIEACRFIKSVDFETKLSSDQPWINVISYNEKGEEIKSGERGYLLFVTEKVDRERVKPFNPFESFSP